MLCLEVDVSRPFREATMNLSLYSIKCTGQHLCKSENPSEGRKVWHGEFTCTKKRVEVEIWKQYCRERSERSWVSLYRWQLYSPAPLTRAQTQWGIPEATRSLYPQPLHCQGWETGPESNGVLCSAALVSIMATSAAPRSPPCLLDFNVHLLLWRQASNPKHRPKKGTQVSLLALNSKLIPFLFFP